MSWSYSKLLDFEQCKYRYKLKHIDRVPEAKSEAADRGTAMHTMAENFVLGKLKSLPTELLKFSNDFVALRTKFETNHVSLEGEWAFDKNWEPTAYKTGWLRMKADAVCFNKLVKPTEAVVIDYKSGKKWGNECKHGEQTQLYSLATALRNPTVKKITAELWYLDKDDLTTVTYTREQAIALLKPFDKRAGRIDKAHETGVFEPNPNPFTCQWCPYGPNKSKECTHGVTTSMTISDYRKKFL